MNLFCITTYSSIRNDILTINSSPDLKPIHSSFFSFVACCFLGTLLVAFAQIKDSYKSIRCSTTIVSTWHERTESMSFAGRFVRLDPLPFLSSRSYAGTYQFLYFILPLKTFPLYNWLVSFESERKFLISSQILFVFFFEVLL